MDVPDKQHVVVVAAAEGRSSGPMCAALSLYISSKEKMFYWQRFAVCCSQGNVPTDSLCH